MCKCISNNAPKPEQTDPLVPLVAPWPRDDGSRRPIGIDACIAPVIQQLWDARVATQGSCCGHNDTAPSVVLSSAADADAANAVLAADGRPWAVYAWVLTNLAEPVEATPSESTEGQQ